MLAQEVLLDLSRRGYRERVDEHPMKRNLVWRQALMAIRAQPVGVGCAFTGRSDECSHLLAPRRVGDANDCDVRDILVLEQHLLDFAWIDILATSDDHVLESAGDAENPRLSIAARSPVCSQPSESIAAAVASGLSK